MTNDTENSQTEDPTAEISDAMLDEVDAAAMEEISLSLNAVGIEPGSKVWNLVKAGVRIGTRKLAVDLAKRGLLRVE